MDVKVVQIPETVVRGKRLGRHVEHDPRSRNFPFEARKIAGRLGHVVHRRHGRIFDQGDLGSCTGNAIAGAINTEPNYVVHHNHLLHEQDAVDLYELATTIDDVEGSYPPEDTGSSGLAAGKAAQQKGLISSYQHAFGIGQAINALQERPVITGVNWYEGFDHPDGQGLVQIAGQIRGGHEFVIIGFEPADDLMDAVIVADNSWGSSWGQKGKFRFTARTWDQLLNEQGDVTVPIK